MFTGESHCQNANTLLAAFIYFQEIPSELLELLETVHKSRAPKTRPAYRQRRARASITGADRGSNDYMFFWPRIGCNYQVPACCAAAVGRWLGFVG